MEMGMIPWRLTSPSEGEKPTKLFLVEGLRIDEPVSVPRPACAKRAARLAPVPAEEPPGIFSRLYGLSVCPPRELVPVPPRANSSRFVFAMMITPAARNFFTVNASYIGLEPASALDPPVVGRSK